MCFSYGAVIDVVIRTAGIVTLTHGAHVTTTIDISSYTAAQHGDRGITEYLTGNKTVNLGFMSTTTNHIIQCLRIGTLTLTAAIERVAYQTTFQCYFSVAIDVAVLTTAMYRASDTLCIIVIMDSVLTRHICSRRIVDIHFGFIGVC